MIETTPHPLPEDTVPVAGDEAGPASAHPEGGPRELSWVQVALVLVVCAGALLALERFMGVYMPDDAYITYRYAENLAAGKGLVFNAAAPPVEGYSNLSWILLLAVLARLGLDLPVWAANLGALLSVVNLGLLYALSLRVVRHRGWALVAPALLALTAPYALWARGGLETMWYATLLLFSVLMTVLGLGGRVWAYPLAAVGLFALALTRHDGAIPLALSGLFVLISLGRDRFGKLGAASEPGAGGGSAANWTGPLAGFRANWTGRSGPIGGSAANWTAWAVPIVSFGALAVAYLAYTWWRAQYFGQLVPTPFFSRLGGTMGNPGQAFLTWGSYFTRGSNYSAYGDLLVPAFALAAACLAWLRRPGLRDWYILSCVAALSLLYFFSESYNPGIRYMVPVLPLLYLYAQEPLAALLRLVWGKAGAGVDANRWLPVGMVSTAIGIFLLVMAPRTQHDGERAEQAKHRSLVPLGQWLRAYAPPTSTVALQDIGAVAYYSGLRVIDNNPGALTNGDLTYRRGVEGFANITLDPRPEFLVFTSGSDRTLALYLQFDPLTRDPRFTNGYTLYNKVKYWEDRGYWVYRRNDVSLPPAAADAFPHTEWYEP